MRADTSLCDVRLTVRAAGVKLAPATWGRGMAIYHAHVQVIGRSAGRSVVAAAAYRAAERLRDERLDRDHDFTAKAGVVHSEVLLPAGAPDRWADREVLWNEVEASEKRKDAQLAREVEFALPRELDQAQAIALARDFAAEQFVARGMVADLNVHWDVAADGGAKPHAHVMLTMRHAGPDGFGAKARGWNSTELYAGVRERWASLANARLAVLGHDARIDHRSFAEQGIALEPQHKIGPAAARRAARGEAAERRAEHEAIARRNGERILEEPSVALDALTWQHSTFTRQDLARFVHRHSEGAEQFALVLAKLEAAPELVRLGTDGNGRERLTTKGMLAAEARMERSAAELAAGRRHGVAGPRVARAVDEAERRGLRLSAEQRDAVAHVTRDGGLALVVGYAGTGKSALLGVARDAWEGAGYRVRGAALSGVAAQGLEAGSGIASRTLASWEHAWRQGREELTSRDVLVVDEAGMVGSRQLDGVLAAARGAGAKVVLVGDPEQLQAIAAGAAFRALVERHGAAELGEVRRQRVDWQRQATRELATGRTAEALARYAAAGMVHGHATQAEARAALVAGWDAERRARPGDSRILLAATRADAQLLNELARERLRAAGELGPERTLATERGPRAFAAGDRVMFLKNERGLGVKNGTLGTVERVDGRGLAVRVDGGGRVAFELKAYAQIDHGFAATIHKAQGVTVDRAHVLAGGPMDRHATYVALSRHREGVALHWSAEAHRDRAGLVRALSRERAKDTTLDYDRASFAQRRGIAPSSEIAVPDAMPSRAKRGMFDGLRLTVGRAPAPAPVAAPAPLMQGELERAVDRYARAWTDAARMEAQGLPVLEHQHVALREAGAGLDAARPGAKRDLEQALRYEPTTQRAMNELQGPARTTGLITGIAHEARVRQDPELRAGRLVKVWQGLEARHAKLGGWDKAAARGMVEDRMREVARELRDPRLGPVLRARGEELGIAAGSRLARVLQGPDLDRALRESLRQGQRQGYGLSR